MEEISKILIQNGHFSRFKIQNLIEFKEKSQNYITQGIRFELYDFLTFLTQIFKKKNRQGDKTLRSN